MHGFLRIGTLGVFALVSLAASGSAQEAQENQGAYEKRYPPLDIRGTYLWDSDIEKDGGSFSMTELEIGVKVPLWTEAPLLVALTPEYEVRMLGGSPDFDLPETLHHISPALLFSYAIDETWGLIGRFVPSFDSDFKHTGSDALHLSGGIGVSYAYSEDLTLYGQLIYVDRADSALYPVLGIDWRIDERWRLSLMAPRPRVIYRPAERVETWLGFEVNLDEYAVEVESIGEDDLLLYEDYRVMAGVNWWLTDYALISLEGGGAFGRELEYDRLDVNRNVDSAALAQVAFEIRL